MLAGGSVEEEALVASSTAIGLARTRSMLHVCGEVAPTSSETRRLVMAYCPRVIRPDALMRRQPHHGSKLLASTGDAVSAKNFLTAPRSVVLKYAPQLNS